MLTKTAGVIVTAGIISGCESKDDSKKPEKNMTAYQGYKNEDFYNADGSFNAEKAKQAFYEMFTYFNYPIVDKLKTDEFWVADFGLGRFAEVGMGGIFWVNNLEDNYFGHEIYLLPGQRIPEHGHDKTDKAGPKMEAWQVRHGMIHTYAEGEPTPGVDADIPEEEKQYWIAKTRTKVMPGEVAQLEVAESMHWMRGGPEGAIVTEYATYHDNDGLKFSNPNVTM